MNEVNTIRTLWHGTPLSVYEELSLLSFVRCGHKVEVYSYDQLDVPTGVHLCDANRILTQSQVFAYSKGVTKGSFAAVSNLFRYKLLFEKGGIWADADMLCLKSLHQLPDACVGRQDDELINGAFMKFSAGHPICRQLYERAAALGKDIRHGQAGPKLVTEVFSKSESSYAILPPSAFYPIHWRESFALIKPEELTYCDKKTDLSYCVHWWNTGLRLIGLPKDALPPKGSFLYERAKTVLQASKLRSWPYDSVRVLIENFERNSASETGARGS